MNELHYVLGELLDALWRGVCFAAMFAIAFPVCILVAKKTPGLLKAAGVWQ